MDWQEVREFVVELKILRSFLFEIAANRDFLSIVGPRGMRTLKGFEEAVNILPHLESNLYECERTARFVDSKIADRIAKVNEQSPLISQSMELKLSIEIEGGRRNVARGANVLRRVLESYARLLGVPKFRSVFVDGGEIPIRQMLSDMDRLIPFVENLEDTYFTRIYNDEEIFKPSNVNIEEVKVYIDSAMLQVSLSSLVDSDTKARLDSYLSEVRAELAKKDPSWKKVVGALVIVSAILGGIAVAPEAFANINSAVKYILGTSIKEKMPRTDFGPGLLPPTSDA